jgi:hypothetical protein
MSTAAFSIDQLMELAGLAVSQAGASIVSSRPVALVPPPLRVSLSSLAHEQHSWDQSVTACRHLIKQ